MKPQGFGQMGGGNLEDLGWNDMGFEPPKPTETARDAAHDAFGEQVVDHPRGHPTGLTPVSSPVHGQQAKIADSFTPEQVPENFASDEFEAEDETAELYQPEATFQPQPEVSFEAEAEAEPEVAFEPEAEELPQPVLPTLATKRPVKAAVIAVTPEPAPRRAPRPRSAAGAKGKAAFTLRLDPQRHLKLRLACAMDGRSAQQIVTDALDQLLERTPELDAMAQTAARKG